jgi:hypothetical protein
MLVMIEKLAVKFFNKIVEQSHREELNAVLEM